MRSFQDLYADVVAASLEAKGSPIAIRHGLVEAVKAMGRVLGGGGVHDPGSEQQARTQADEAMRAWQHWKEGTSART